jgi:hypothetical protein
LLAVAVEAVHLLLITAVVVVVLVGIELVLEHLAVEQMLSQFLL